MGDTSVPSSGIDNQKRFINRIVEDIYDNVDFRGSSCATNYAFSGTTQALPGDFGHIIEVREIIAGTDTDVVYEERTSADQDAGTSEYISWTTGNEEDGYVLNINQTDNPTLKVTYKCAPETLTNNSDTTRIPRSMPIARGALAYMQEAEDPYRDTSDAWAKYERSKIDLIRLTAHQEPPKKFFTRSQYSSKPIGQPRG